MQILEDGQKWLLMRQAFKLSGQRFKCHLLLALWRQVRRKLRWDRQEVGQNGHIALSHFGLDEQCLQLFEPLPYLIIGAEPCCSFELRYDGVQRAVAMVWRTEIAQANVWFLANSFLECGS